MPYGNSDYLEHPFTGPYMRAQEMTNFMEDMKFKREQRQMARDQYAAEMEDRRRKRGMEDFATVLHLHAMGYTPLEEGDAGDSYLEKTGLQSTRDPSGQRMVAPTATEQSQNLDEQARQTGRRKGLTQVAMDEETGGKSTDMETIPMPDWVPGERTREVKKGTGASVLANLYSKKLGKPLRPITNKQTGDVSFVDDEGTVVKTVKGIAGKATTAGSQKDYEAEVDAASDPSGELIKRMDDMRGSVYQRLKINPRTATPQETESAEKYLRTVVEDAMKKERGVKIAKRRLAGGGTSPTVGTTTTTPSGPKTPVGASKLSWLLSQPQTKARGIRDINSLRKDLLKHGYTIAEDQ